MCRLAAAVAAPAGAPPAPVCASAVRIHRRGPTTINTWNTMLTTGVVSGTGASGRRLSEIPSEVPAELHTYVADLDWDNYEYVGPGLCASEGYLQADGSLDEDNDPLWVPQSGNKATHFDMAFKSTDNAAGFSKLQGRDVCIDKGGVGSPAPGVAGDGTDKFDSECTDVEPADVYHSCVGGTINLAPGGARFSNCRQQVAIDAGFQHGQTASIYPTTSTTWTHPCVPIVLLPAKPPPPPPPPMTCRTEDVLLLHVLPLPCATR